jgi:hypothetical protein
VNWQVWHGSSEAGFFQPLPFLFRDEGVECVNNGGNGFKILAEGARDFGESVILAERAAEFERRCVGPGEFFDAPIKMIAVYGNIFAEGNEDVAE